MKNSASSIRDKLENVWELQEMQRLVPELKFDVYYDREEGYLKINIYPEHFQDPENGLLFIQTKYNEEGAIKMLESWYKNRSFLYMEEPMFKNPWFSNAALVDFDNEELVGELQIGTNLVVGSKGEYLGKTLVVNKYPNGFVLLTGVVKPPRKKLFFKI